MKKLLIIIAAIFLLAGCQSQPQNQPADNPEENGGKENVNTETGKAIFVIEVNGHQLIADFADNKSAQAFKELLQQGELHLHLQDYGDFEKVGPLGTSLVRSDESIQTQAGDVILYQGNQITIYYDHNSWTFTRLGKIRDVDTARLKEILGPGDVDVVIRLEKE